MSETQKELQAIKSILKAQVATIAILLALMWGLESLDLAWGGSLDRFGIRPRAVSSLSGILAAPFLHGGWRHLISNTIPFAVLGWLIMLRGLDEFWVVTVLAALASGLGTWLFGASGTLHIGASGVIFGYFGFLLTRAHFERSFGSIALAVLVFALFGGMIWGILPIRIGISWEGHLFGLLGGVLSAYLISWIRRASDRLC